MPDERVDEQAGQQDASAKEPEAPQFDAATATLADFEKHETDLAKAAEEPAKPEPAKPEPAKPEQKQEAAEEPEDEPEIQAEIDKIEKPADGENPQERSARTKRNRRKAQRAYATRVTRERDEARTELDKLKQQLAAYKTPRLPEKPPPGATYNGIDPKDPRPSKDKYDLTTDEGATRFYDDSTEWHFRRQRRIEQFNQQQERAQAATVERRRAAERETRSVQDKLFADNKKYAETHADFDEVTGDIGFGADVAYGSTYLENGPAVLYHLAKNPSELEAVQRQFRENPRLGMVSLGRLGATIAAAANAPPKPSSAPDPPEKQAAGRSAAAASESKKVEDMDLKEFEAYERALAKAS